MTICKWIGAGSLIVALAFLPSSAAAAKKVRSRAGFHIDISAPVYRSTARFFYGSARYQRPMGNVYWGPRIYRVHKVNYGEVDFNIKPEESHIFIDGKYLGIADDFNGYPQTAKLPAGYYSVRIVSPDGSVEERRIYVAVGQEYNYNYEFK